MESADKHAAYAACSAAATGDPSAKWGAGFHYVEGLSHRICWAPDVDPGTEMWCVKVWEDFWHQGEWHGGEFVIRVEPGDLGPQLRTLVHVRLEG